MGETSAKKGVNSESATPNPQANLRDGSKSKDKQLLSGWAALDGVDAGQALRNDLIAVFCNHMDEKDYTPDRREEALMRVLPIFNTAAAVGMELIGESKETIDEFIKSVAKIEKEDLHELLKKKF